MPIRGKGQLRGSLFLVRKRPVTTFTCHGDVGGVGVWHLFLGILSALASIHPPIRPSTIHHPRNPPPSPSFSQPFDFFFRLLLFSPSFPSLLLFLSSFLPFFLLRLFLLVLTTFPPPPHSIPLPIVANLCQLFLLISRTLSSAFLQLLSRFFQDSRFSIVETSEDSF